MSSFQYLGNSHLSSPEPMSPGSPVQIAPNNLNSTTGSPYLPGYLLGDNTPTAPVPTPQLWPQQTSALTKNKSNLSNMSSHADSTKKRVVFSPLPPSTIRIIGNRSAADKHGGPPTQSLFDHSSNSTVASEISLNQSKVNELPETNPLNVTGPAFMNTSVTSPVSMKPDIGQDSVDLFSGNYHQDENTWVIIYGFPPNAGSFIIQQFSQYGNIHKYKMPDNSNWMYVCYQSKLQARKAMSKNGKIIGGNMMVGVKLCDNNMITDFAKENSLNTSNISVLRESGMEQSQAQNSSRLSGIRPLTQAYMVASSERDVNMSQIVPQKSNSIFTKAMDYVFGW